MARCAFCHQAGHNSRTCPRIVTELSGGVRMSFTGPLRLIIHGDPRTKKNHNALVPVGRRCAVCGRARQRLLPSKQWREWYHKGFLQVVGGGQCPTIVEPVNCEALFYRSGLGGVGDAVGYYQGLADFLEGRGVVENDRLLATWNGSDVFVDKDHPRVEVTLSPRGTL